MMKRVLVFVPSLEIGGTTVSLYSLLKSLDSTRIAFDIFPIIKAGPYLGLMENCRVLDENCWLSESYTHASGINRFRIIFVKTLKAISRYLHIDISSICIRLGAKQLQTDHYDAVVSFQENITSFVSRIPATKRIAWIHCDYARFLTICGGTSEIKIYEKIDKVVCVSAYAKSVFDSIYPLFSNKTITIHNVIDVTGIRQKSQDTSSLDPLFDTSSFTIVTAGRMDPVKQFDKIPIIAKQIRDITCLPFKWYIIGGSRGFENMEIEMQDSIDRLDLNNVVIRLSEKSNIYPYISQADLYVCTSVSESFPLVVNEAKALGVPVVSNNFPSVKESITDGVDGIIVPLESMPEKIADIINNGVKSMVSDINNEIILNQVYHLFEA